MRRLLHRLKPAALPVAIGASVLLICWFYLMWNTTIGEAIPALRFRTKNTIAGIVEQSAPMMSFDAVLTGKYQQWVSRSVGELSPVFRQAIGWKNQIYYSLLGMSGTDIVEVGAHDQLLQIGYVSEYCSRDLGSLRTKAEPWAARIRAMQDFFEARGQVFLYVITPSKVAVNPDVLPSAYRCTAPESDRERKLPVYDQILARHGVNLVDTASPMRDAQKRYGIRVFPRGGIHWNALGATLAAQQVIAAVDARHSGAALGELAFTWKVSDSPKGEDRDLLDMLNLPYPDASYPVPALTYRRTPPPSGCVPLQVTEVGGSFLMGLNAALEQSDCAPKITFWFYWDEMRLDRPGEHTQRPPLDAAARRQSLLTADVVIFEENEFAVAQSFHGESFMREVAALAQGAENTR